MYFQNLLLCKQRIHTTFNSAKVTYPVKLIGWKGGRPDSRQIPQSPPDRRFPHGVRVDLADLQPGLVLEVGVHPLRLQLKPQLLVLLARNLSHYRHRIIIVMKKKEVTHVL